MTMPRMRTAACVYEIIKEEDPETEVTLSFIRRIIQTGQVPVTAVGRKKLVDADAVIAYITTGNQPEPDSDLGPAGKIRPVKPSGRSKRTPPEAATLRPPLQRISDALSVDIFSLMDFDMASKVLENRLNSAPSRPSCTQHMPPSTKKASSLS